MKSKFRWALDVILWFMRDTWDFFLSPLCFVFVLAKQSHLHINILAWSRPLMTFLMGRVFLMRLANTLIGGRELYKGEGRPGMSYWARNRNQSTRKPHTHALFSRVDFSEQPFPSLHFVPDRAPVRVAHPYLNTIHRQNILYSALQRPVVLLGDLVPTIYTVAPVPSWWS